MRVFVLFAVCIFCVCASPVNTGVNTGRDLGCLVQLSYIMGYEHAMDMCVDYSLVAAARTNQYRILDMCVTGEAGDYVRSFYKRFRIGGE